MRLASSPFPCARKSSAVARTPPATDAPSPRDGLGLVAPYSRTVPSGLRLAAYERRGVLGRPELPEVSDDQPKMVDTKAHATKPPAGIMSHLSTYIAYVA